MIFHDYIYNGHHMMDWDLGNWFFMILGWGITISVVLIILYMALQSSTKKNQTHENVIRKEIDMTTYDKVEDYDAERNNSDTANFCYNCGENLGGEAMKFCPRCRAKITR